VIPVFNVYRITKSPAVGDLLDSVEAVEAYVGENGLGRYAIDEHAADPSPGSESTARGWDSMIQHRGGQVVLDPIARRSCQSG
jgi:hypothetical protein